MASVLQIDDLDVRCDIGSHDQVIGQGPGEVLALLVVDHVLEQGPGKAHDDGPQLLPLNDNPNTADLQEHIREQTVPASAPPPGSSKATPIASASKQV